MNGAESLVRTLTDCGVDTCFANPGTSEMHFVAALDSVPGMRPILCLFEGVVTGAADGYGRILEKPAVTLLHLGPGMGNGLANLHNARRAGTPLINVVGDHATYHLQYDAPLTSDLEGFARPVSHWMKTSKSSKTVAGDGALAVQAAMRAPGQIATLLLPADTAWDEATGPARPLTIAAPAQIADGLAGIVADKLRTAERPAILIRGKALQAEGLEHASRIAAKTGARILCDTFAPRLRRGAGVPAATNGLAPGFLTATAKPHDHLALTGGSIGMGLPVAVGAAVAAPDRKVVCLHGDGGAMYTLQSLWTMARENLDVTTVIFANRSYAILNIELGRVGAGVGGPKALSTLDIGNPNLNWVSLAEGMGVEATAARTAEEFNVQLESALATQGPRLIEAIL
jgi:thiamine pyrophosphate-dependent acetolactate synthase large subunit-like protein